MRFLLIAFVLVWSKNYAQAQDPVQVRHTRYMDHAEVRHNANSTTVSANDSRPLAQALTALSEEYGWVIDFEDPPYYSKYDLVDDTDAKWRASHPSAKGVTVIAGESFQTQFPKNSSAAGSPTEEEYILNTVVRDYNASSNPGKFRIVNEGNGRFGITGISVKGDDGQEKPITPILDTLISVPAGTRDTYTTIQAILNALTAKSGTKVVPFFVPTNALAQSQVTVGGQNVPARILLLQTLSAANLKLYWRLYYDHDVSMYGFSLLTVGGGRN